ncbi:MAG: DinB family protein [Ignavibacteria bacterium]
MIKSIKQTELMLNMNTSLFNNALEGVTETQSTKRISDHSNSLIWLYTHTVWGRYLICGVLGKPVAKNPYEGMFENFKPFDPSDKYQTLEEVKAEWSRSTELLNEALASVTEEYLSADCPFKSQIGDNTNGGTFAFLVQHESYDIGQMAFLKKYYTKEAMKY